MQKVNHEVVGGGEKERKPLLRLFWWDISKQKMFFLNESSHLEVFLFIDWLPNQGYR